MAAINLTGSAEGALVPVLLRITNWTKSGLPVSPPGLFPPWFDVSAAIKIIMLNAVGLAKPEVRLTY